MAFQLLSCSTQNYFSVSVNHSIFKFPFQLNTLFHWTKGRWLCYVQDSTLGRDQIQYCELWNEVSESIQKDT